jgi:hypothetical protein
MRNNQRVQDLPLSCINRSASAKRSPLIRLAFQKTGLLGVVCGGSARMSTAAGLISKQNISQQVSPSQRFC